MFSTKYNDQIRKSVLALNRRKIDNLEGIESGDSFEDMQAKKGSAYGASVMTGGKRTKHKNSRQEEFDAVSKMDILPQNTNLPDNSKSTLNSKLYLPIKQSGAYQTPSQVLQFYQTGGLQGAGVGEAEIAKVEGGARMVGGDRNVTDDLAARMSELSGFGKPSMLRLLGKLKKKLRGSGFFDSLMSGLKTVNKYLPAVIEHAPAVLNAVDSGRKFLGFGKRGKKMVLAKELIEKLADDGANEFKGAGTMNHMLADMMPLPPTSGSGLDLSPKAGFLAKEGSGAFGDIFPVLGMMGLGKKRKLKKKVCGGYDINIAKPLPVIAPLEDLRGNLRPKENVPAMVEGTGKMSKAKARGMLVARVMKERGVKLGEASKIVSEMVKLKGKGWWDDFTSGFSSVVQAALPLLPLLV
jgi:hypothetical protein